MHCGSNAHIAFWTFLFCLLGMIKDKVEIAGLNEEKNKLDSIIAT
jgi:hypothetical protein